MRTKKCAICGGRIKVGQNAMPPEIAAFSPNAHPIHPDLFKDWEMEGHMAFEHGLSRTHKDTDAIVAEHYTYVVGEPRTVNGRKLQWNDKITVKNGKVVLHVPGGIYPPSNVTVVTRRASGTIRLP